MRFRFSFLRQDVPRMRVTALSSRSVVRNALRTLWAYLGISLH